MLDRANVSQGDALAPIPRTQSTAKYSRVDRTASAVSGRSSSINEDDEKSFQARLGNDSRLDSVQNYAF